MLLGFVLGPLMEETLRRAMLLSRGDPTIFLTNKISLTMLLMSAAALALSLYSGRRKPTQTAGRNWSIASLREAGGRMREVAPLTRSRDFWSGLMFAFIGVSAFVIAQGYDVGTASRMGAGYFPELAGGLLALLGVATIGRAIVFDRTEAGRFALRPMVLIIGAVVAFALLLDPAGLAIAGLVLVVLSRLGGYEFRIREVLISYVLMVAAAWMVFVYWLGLPISLLP